MILIDSKKGTMQFSGSILTIQAELSALLREFRKEIDPEHGDELINEMVRVSKLTDEEMDKEVIDCIHESLSKLSSLSNLFDKLNTSGEKIDRDTFESMFGDLLNNKDGNHKKNKKGE